MRFTTTHLDDVDRLENDGLIWRPVRRTLGVTAFGINGYSSGLRYELACFAAMGGRHDEAIEHLVRAVAANPRMREFASDDRELDPIRDRPDYPARG